MYYTYRRTTDFPIGLSLYLRFFLSSLARQAYASEGLQHRRQDISLETLYQVSREHPYKCLRHLCMEASQMCPFPDSSGFRSSSLDRPGPHVSPRPDLLRLPSICQVRHDCTYELNPCSCYGSATLKLCCCISC